MMVFVGAMEDRRKGFDTVFEAWKILCGDPRWDGDLAVIGIGSETSIWLERARRLRIERRVHFLGFRSDVPALLRACDAMIAPTRYEAYGLGIHEALCCGLPAFVSSDAGVAERYPTELRDLLLPDPEDVNALVQRLRTWRDNVYYWRERVLPFSRELRRYTWNDMSRDIVVVAESNADSKLRALA
jgi:glycosyltransferase involved in cell wall biosynthesis